MIEISRQKLSSHQKISATIASEGFGRKEVRRGYTSLEDFAMSAKAGGAIVNGEQKMVEN